MLIASVKILKLVGLKSFVKNKKLKQKRSEESVRYFKTLATALFLHLQQFYYYTYQYLQQLYNYTSITYNRFSSTHCSLHTPFCWLKKFCVFLVVHFGVLFVVAWQVVGFCGGWRGCFWLKIWRFLTC